MSSTNYSFKKDKQIKKKQINIFDSEKILFEKNEALKELELNDDVIYDNLNFHTINEKFNKQSTKEIINDSSLIKSSNIVIVSDRSCNYVHDLIEKNINKLEKQIKNNSEKNNFRKYKKY
jgi:hypothetical protein